MTTSTLSKFIDGTLSTGFGKLSIVSISLLSFIVTTRWLTIEDLGIFVLLKVIVSFLVEFSSLGVDITITRFLAGTENVLEKKKLINTVVTFRIISLVATSIIALIAKDVLFLLFGTSIYSDILIFIPVLLMIDGLNNLYNGIFAGSFNFRMIGLTDLINSLLGFLAIIILVVWQDSGVMGRVYARLYASSITLLFILLFGKIHFKPQIDFQELKKILKFGFPLYINYFLSFAFLRADTLIIGAYLGPAEIALYEIAKTIPDSLDMIYDAFNKVYFSFISKFFQTGEKIRATIMLNQSVRILSFLGFFGALIVFLFGQNIIILLFKEKYLPSVTAFALLMIVFTFLIIESTYGNSLVALGEPDKPPLINILHTIINFIGYILLIKPLGINGLALAGMVGSAFVIPFNIFFLRKRQVETKYHAILKPVLIFTVCLSLFFIFHPSAFFIKILFLILYLVGCYFFSVFTKHDIQIINREGKLLIKRIQDRRKN